MRLYSEELINGIETTLKNNMATTLTAAQTAAGDDLVLDNIAEYQKAWLQILNRPDYPTIGIQPAPYRYEPAGYQVMDGEYEFDIVCAISDADSENLQKKLLRYSEVIREIIQRNPTLEGVCLEAYPSGGNFKPAASGLSVCVVTVVAQTEIR